MKTSPKAETPRKCAATRSRRSPAIRLNRMPVATCAVPRRLIRSRPHRRAPAHGVRGRRRTRSYVALDLEGVIDGARREVEDDVELGASRRRVQTGAHALDQRRADLEVGRSPRPLDAGESQQIARRIHARSAPRTRPACGTERRRAGRPLHRRHPSSARSRAGAAPARRVRRVSGATSGTAAGAAAAGAGAATRSRREGVGQRRDGRAGASGRASVAGNTTDTGAAAASTGSGSSAIDPSPPAGAGSPCSSPRNDLQHHERGHHDGRAGETDPDSRRVGDGVSARAGRPPPCARTEEPPPSGAAPPARRCDRHRRRERRWSEARW